MEREAARYCARLLQTKYNRPLAICQVPFPEGGKRQVVASRTPRATARVPAPTMTTTG